LLLHRVLLVNQLQNLARSVPRPLEFRRPPHGISIGVLLTYAYTLLTRQIFFTELIRHPSIETDVTFSIDLLRRWIPRSLNDLLRIQNCHMILLQKLLKTGIVAVDLALRF
jgi:hypothetical protein